MATGDGKQPTLHTACAQCTVRPVHSAPPMSDTSGKSESGLERTTNKHEYKRHGVQRTPCGSPQYPMIPVTDEDIKTIPRSEEEQEGDVANPFCASTGKAPKLNGTTASSC